MGGYRWFVPEHSEPVRVSLPRAAWAPFAVGGVIMLALLGVQVALIEDQRSTTDKQLRTAVRQAGAALPLLQEARPLVRETRPLVDDLRKARPEQTLRNLRAVSRDLLRAELPATLERLPEALEGVSALTAEALTQDRLRRLLVRANAVLGEVLARNTVPKASRAAALIPDLHRTLRRSLDVQQRLLATQVQALRAAEETREIARRTERHVENLDRKLGGGPPPAP